MKFALLFLWLTALLSSFSAQAQTRSSDGTVVPFAINMRVAPFAEPYLVGASLLDDRIIERFPEQVTADFYTVMLTYRQGIVVLNDANEVIAYITNGGEIRSTYWRIVFDPAMTGQQRRHLLALVEPYVRQELSRATESWLQYTLLEPTGVLEPVIKIDFINGDNIARDWLVSVFGQYKTVLVEDSAGHTRYNLATIAADGPFVSTDTTSLDTGKVIRGFDFNSVYSSNLKQRIKLNSDGTISVFTTKTGVLLTTILPAETGIPKIRYMGASLQVDYGPGKNRYFYNSGDFKLLYTTKNYAPPARPNPSAIGAGLRCSDLFRF